MKKKLLFLTGLCILGICVWEAQAMNGTPLPVIENAKADPPHGYEKINLQGTLMLGIGPNGIVAGASDNEIYIQFNQSFGNVSITIYNSSNLVVYSTVVDTSVQQVVVIPFTTAAADTYTVELSHADDYAEGDFEKN